MPVAKGNSLIKSGLKTMDRIMIRQAPVMFRQQLFQTNPDFGITYIGPLDQTSPNRCDRSPHYILSDKLKTAVCRGCLEKVCYIV
jgi:hypothetical protein